MECDFLFERVEIAVGGSDINDVAGDHGRGQDRSYSVEFADANHHVVVEVRRESGFIVRTAIGFRERRQILARGLRLESPDGFSGVEIDGDEFAVLSSEVERVACDGGRAEDGPVELE